MKIEVRHEGMHLRLRIPTRMIFSRPVQYLANHTARKYAPKAMENISPEAMGALFSELRRIKKKYGSWDLVEVQSADGEIVRIIL